jgi:hypothetical protein
MKFLLLKSAVLSLLVSAASVCGANILTVGPTGQYATPCPAIKAAAAGDTIQVDANNGVPYSEPADATTRNRSDCVFFTNNLTIVGVNGRPVLDAAGLIIEKAIFDVYGHDVVIDNFEMRNAATVPGTGDNGAGVRIESGNATTPGGGNVTIRHSYIHDNQDGVLTANVGPGTGGSGPDQQYFSANPFITLEYDEFARNGVGGDGHTHNMYIGFGGNLNFTLQYSWSHDAYLGHTVKSRAPINNILYNLITDQLGATSYMLDFPLGGSTYVVGNSIYKTAVTNGGANKSWMMWRDVGDSGAADPDYNTPNEDLHFTNNTVVLDPSSNSPAFVIMSCTTSDQSTCPTPTLPGLPLSVNAVVENNVFVGPPSQVSNQTNAIASNNTLVANTSANLAALFVDAVHFDYHLVSGSTAIHSGRYPLTDSTGATDPKALAVYEYQNPIGRVTRPTPSGTVMDEGAYSYPRADTPPTPVLNYTQSVTTPGSGTINLTGLPTPPAGQLNNASFVSGNAAVISPIAPVSSATSSITATFQANSVSTTTVVPIDIYVDGAHLVANVTVNPGAVALGSITLDTQYYPRTTVHLTNPSTSPVVVTLSSTDQSILYVPTTVTIPANQTSASTGSETGSLWGQTPSSKTATITATYAGVTQTLPVVVYPPHVNHFYCNVYPCTVVGGQPVNNFEVAIAGDFPPSGGQVTFISDTPSVVPNQTFQQPGGNFYSGFILTTNAVTTATQVTMSISVNGSTKTPNQVITVNPGGVVASSIAVVSGSGQSAQVGTSFTNPFVVVVKDGSNNPLPNATVTYAGTGLTFPNGTTAVTNSSGQASVTAGPTSAGALTVTATVANVATPASFSETGTSSVAVSSVTLDGGDTYRAATTVTLTAAAPAGGAVVTITSSDQTIVHAPSTVTVPAGQLSAEIGTILGSLWGQSPSTKTATLTATYGGVSTTLTSAYNTPGLHGAYCNSSCTLTGGQGLSVTMGLRGYAPFGGSTVQYTSDNTAVIPNQTFPIGAGQNSLYSNLVTNTVAATTTVNLTFNFNGDNWITIPITVNAGANAPASIAAVSGSGQTSPVGTSFTNPLVSVVTNSSGVGIAGVTVTFAGTGVTFPGGATALTNSSGQASVTAQPSTAGALTATASAGSLSATFSETGTAVAVGVTDVIAINAGGGAAGTYVADTYVSGGNAYSNSNSIDVSSVVNPAPQAVYQSERWGAQTYTIPALTPGTTYNVRLHFAEIYWSAVGQRRFNVVINGTQVLTNFDILATAGAQNKAVIETFNAIATSSGQIVIQFTNGAVDSPKVSGIEIQTVAEVVAINSGGGAAGTYVADTYVSGGNAYSNTNSIDVSSVVSPAPQAVYQSERWGAQTYTIPALTPGTTYNVRLHFAEIYWNAVGQRKFNVLINGTQVLTEFDIFATAGAMNKAVVETFNAIANSSGQIVVQYTAGSVDNPKSSGIEIQ